MPRHGDRLERCTRIFATLLSSWLGLEGAIVDLGIGEIAKSVAIYLGVPFAAGFLTRRSLVRSRGRDGCERSFVPGSAPPRPNVSRHLAVLRGAGVVNDRREGSWVYYGLVPPQDPDCARYLRELVQTYAKRDVLRRDVERLLRTRGPGACR
jgi:hypothetical protein